MAAIAPDPTEHGDRAGSDRSSRPGNPARASRIEDREPATGRLHRDRPRLHAGRRRPGGRGGEGGPAGVGRDELPGAGPDPPPRGRDLRGEPRRVRDVDAARDRRLPQQDAPRVELRLPGDPERGDAAVPAVRLAHADRAVKGRLSMVRRVPVGVIGAITPWNSPSRAGDARGRAGAGRSATPSSSSRTRRRRSSAARCSRPSSARRACPTACSRSSSVAPTSARRSSPTRTSRSCRSPARPRSGGGSASWPAACSRRSRSSSAGTTRSSCSTTPISTRRRPRAPSRRSSSRARSASRPAATSSIGSIADAYIDALTEKAKRLRLGDPYPRGRPARADRQREAARPGRRHRPALDRGRGPAGRGRHARGPVLPADGARPR